MNSIISMCVLEHCTDKISNSFYSVPVIHFPWSDKGRELRLQKSRSSQV